MANTYTQIYIHMVFSVKGRESLLVPEIEPEVHKMLTTILQNNGHKLIAIGGDARPRAYLFRDESEGGVVEFGQGDEDGDDGVDKRTE